ncbi:MAG: hypothetical protein U1E34_10095 [Amaricoccus sp.]
MDKLVKRSEAAVYDEASAISLLHHIEYGVFAVSQGETVDDMRAHDEIMGCLFRTLHGFGADIVVQSHSGNSTVTVSYPMQPVGTQKG